MSRRALQAATAVLSGFAVGLIMASVIGGTGGGHARQTTSTPAAGGRPILPPDIAASFARLTSSLDGGTVQLALAPIGVGPATLLGHDAPSSGLEPIRLVALVALLRERGARGLIASESADAHAAIVRGQAGAMGRLADDLVQDRGGLAGAGDYFANVLSASGDDATDVSTTGIGDATFDQTSVTPSAAVKFLRALGRRCLLARATTGYVLQLMREAAANQPWGLGAVGAGLRVALIGGAGQQADGTYVVRQSGIVGSGLAAVAVVLVAHPLGVGAAALEDGRQMLTTTARWLIGELEPAVGSRAMCDGP